MRSNQFMNRRLFAFAPLVSLLFYGALFLIQPVPVFAEESGQDDFAALVNDVNVGSTTKKLAAIRSISAAKHPQSLRVLNALLEGDLFYRKSDDVVFVASKTQDGYELYDVSSGEAVATVKKSTIKKVRINNRIRKTLKLLISAYDLGSGEVEVRHAAAKNILREGDPDMETELLNALEHETDRKVAETLEEAVAMIRLQSDDSEERLEALNILARSLEPEVRVRIEAMLAMDEEGNPHEKDPEVLARAKSVAESIEARVFVFKCVENVFFGLSLGSVLLLAAVGLAITFGVMGVINMAHGELIMLGAYTTYVIQQLMPEQIGLSIIIAIPAAFIVSGSVGIVLERGVIRHLYGRPLETLLATFGISLVLQQAVRTIFTPLNKSVASPDWLSGSLEINGVLSLTYNRLYIILFSIMVLLTLTLLLRKTFFGLQVRAVTQNRAMASSMGIRTGWIDAMTFGLGSGIAGIAGVALSQLTNVGPNLGQAYIIDSFMVVVFGGVGNLFGTFFAAMSLGIVNKLAEPFAGAVLAKILVLVFIILFIQRRPRGLFAIKGRFVED